MMALIGTTIERNTTISSRNDSPSTKPSTIHWYVSVTCRKSRKMALFPPTYTCTPGTPAKAVGTTSSRRPWMAANAASFCVVPLKKAETCVADPSWEVATWVSGANAGSFAISACRFFTAAWTCGSCAFPETTINAGSVSPPAKFFSNARNAVLAGTSGSWLMSVELPLFIWK